MSYKHLAGRIVEIQRSMVGPSAITIAQSTDGVSVTSEGNVTAVDDDDPCAVLDTLVDNYTDMLGDPAAKRFRTAATEFQDELDLPASLLDEEGIRAQEERSEPDAAGESVDSGSEVAEESESEADEPTSIEINSPRDESGDAAVAGAVEGNGSQQRAGTADTSFDGSVMVQYTLQNGRTDHDGSDADLQSVYLLEDAEHDWQTPVTVADAITSAVVSAAGLDQEDVGDIEEYVETEQVLSTLYADSGAPVSFEIEDLRVTLYSSGTVRVRHL